MANELKNVFIDYGKRLQSYLDAVAPNVFVVDREKNVEVIDEDKVYVEVSYLHGTTNKDSADVPVALHIYCCGELPQTVIGTFIGISKARSKQSYTEMVEVEEGNFQEAMVFEKIDTPAVLNPDVEFGGNNHWTELVGFCSLLVLFDIGNLKKIAIDDEEIEFLSGSVNYAAETISNRYTGDSLNGQKSKAATTTVQFMIVSKTGVFTNKLLGMAFGLVDKKTQFNVSVEMTNGFKAENIKFIVASSNYNCNLQTPTLPSYNVVLTLADKR